MARTAAQGERPEDVGASFHVLAITPASHSAVVARYHPRRRRAVWFAAPLLQGCYVVRQLGRGGEDGVLFRMRIGPRRALAPWRPVFGQPDALILDVPTSSAVANELDRYVRNGQIECREAVGARKEKIIRLMKNCR